MISVFLLYTNAQSVYRHQLVSVKGLIKDRSFTYRSLIHQAFIFYTKSKK